jgi:hypothetical protein
VSSVRLKVNLVVVEEGHEQSRPGTPQRSPRPWCAPLAAAHDCTRAAIVARFSATYRAMTWLLSLAMCRLLNEEGDAALSMRVRHAGACPGHDEKAEACSV